MNYNFKHFYAMKIHVINDDGWDLKMKVFSGTSKKQALTQAKAWAEDSGYRILETKVISFDDESGANWQVKTWKKELNHEQD